MWLVVSTRLAAAADRELHRIQPRPKVYVIGIGQIARLAVAEIPLELRPLHRQGLRGNVAEQHAHQRHVVVGQRHVVDDLDHEIGRLPGGAQAEAGCRQVADQVRVEHVRRDGHGMLRLVARRHRSPRRRPSWRSGPAAAWSYSNLCWPAASRTSCRLPRQGLVRRPMIPGRRSHQLVVDQQKTAILAGEHETVGGGLPNVHVAAVAAQERARS